MSATDIIAVLDRADALYRQRVNRDAVKQSVTLLANADAAAQRYEAQWRLARALFFLGQEADSIGAKRQLHAAGADSARRAVGLAAMRVEGHFWLGVNLALFAENKSGLKALFSILQAKRELRCAIEIDEAYHGAGALRVLARLLHKVPRLIGGSRRRSRELFERALQLSPTNSVTLLYAAELAIAQGEGDHASALLRRLLDAPVDEQWEFENRRDRKLAAGLLETLL